MSSELLENIYEEPLNERFLVKSRKYYLGINHYRCAHLCNQYCCVYLFNIFSHCLFAFICVDTTLWIFMNSQIEHINNNTIINVHNHTVDINNHDKNTYFVISESLALFILLSLWICKCRMCRK